MNYKNNKQQINADERKERKAVQQESLCPLCSMWLNDFSAPAHEHALPAVHTWLSGTGG